MTEAERYERSRLSPIPNPNDLTAEAVDRAWELHARISVLEQQIRDQKENTALALAAADKAIVNAVVVADKAVAKVELAAEKTYLEAVISSLQEAFRQEILHQKEMTAQALASADKAVQKAEAAAEKRFESVNEFRATLSDQQRELATKTEVNLRFKALEDRVSSVVEDAREIKGWGHGGRQASSDHRTEATDNRVLIFSLIAAGVSILIVAVSIATFLK